MKERTPSAKTQDPAQLKEADPFSLMEEVTPRPEDAAVKHGSYGDRGFDH